MFGKPAESLLPTEEELAKMRADLANLMLVMRANLTPAFDAADGMRADLEKRGWSPTAAEGMAMTWLTRVIVNFTPVGGQE
jgi:hypothetical protein